MEPLGSFASASMIAAAVRAGDISAAEVVETTLRRIETLNPKINAFTDILKARARAHAATIDAAHASGTTLGPLAGVPYAAKNLFDLVGEVTRAGSKINREHAPAAKDAELVQRLTSAGGICLGALNMGEFAYDFTGENVHDGNCRNPHDTARMSGGSSSGSGAATAGGLVPISLGSDTNGSLRVPASLCGVFSLKPTYGRLARGGSFPFVDSLDHVGLFARNVGDLALSYDALQGPSFIDHACLNCEIEPVTLSLNTPIKGLRVGVLRGWFEDNCGDEALRRRDQLLDAVAETTTLVDVTLDQAEMGRAAAYIITHADSAALHLPNLRARPADFDPDTRDRFLAGALLPAAWLEQAQRVRRWWLDEALKAFQDCDVLVAPATPFSAPEIGQKTLKINGVDRPLRPFLGILAQPFSCIGLPVLTAPVFAAGELPIGMQIIAPPWREDTAFKAAAHFERLSAVKARRPDPSMTPDWTNLNF